MENNLGIPAWIVCEDLLVKVKAELANEAIITLQNEVKAARMKIEGRLVSDAEAGNDAERDLFVANEIAAESGKMLQGYSDYIKSMEAHRDRLTSEEVERMENSKRLMLAVGEISMLMGYRAAVEEWILEIEGIPTLNDPVELLASTIRDSKDERFHILEFILNRKSLIRENIFSKEERETFRSAEELVSGRVKR